MRSCPKQGQKNKTKQKQEQKKQSSSIKSFYSNTPYGFEYKKNCINKLSFKMFVKRKTRAEGLCFPKVSEF